PMGVSPPVRSAGKIGRSMAQGGGAVRPGFRRTWYDAYNKDGHAARGQPRRHAPHRGHRAPDGGHGSGGRAGCHRAGAGGGDGGGGLGGRGLTLPAPKGGPGVMTTGELLALCRELKGMSARDVATALGTSQQQVWLWEHDRIRDISFRTAIKLCRFYG